MKQNFGLKIAFSALLLGAAFFIKIPNAEAQKSKTINGAIVVSLPPQCDCTSPSSTCTCKVPVK